MCIVYLWQITSFLCFNNLTNLKRTLESTLTKIISFAICEVLSSNASLHKPVITKIVLNFKSVQFSSVAQSCPALCDPMDCSTPGLPVHHQHPKFTQTHVHWVGDAIQPSHPLPSPSFASFNLSQHQGLFKWIRSSHQVAKVLEFQHQSFQWIFRTNFL